MCFSAEASFGAGALLSIVGIATIKIVKTRSLLPFACIPLVFAFQQFSEGIIWLSFKNPNFLSTQQLAVYNFIIIAQVIWPVLVPLSILQMEKERTQKKILSILLGIGIILAAYHMVCLLIYKISTDVSNHHIFYILDFPKISRVLEGTFYLIPVILSPFVSSRKGMRLLGMLIFSSFLISVLFYKDHVISVWCFFAAVTCIVVYSIIKQAEIETIEISNLIKIQTKAVI